MTTPPFSPPMLAFLEALGKTPRDWRMCNGFVRRGKHDGRCPAEAVFDITGVTEYLYEEEFAPIARAADNLPGHSPALRAAILEACGLREP